MTVVRFPHPPTVDDVIESVAATEDLKAVYVIGIDKNGEGIAWASGNLNDICFASALLQDLMLKFLNGAIETEYE